MGNGVHFFLKMGSNAEFDAESDDADRFFKKVPKVAILSQKGPRWIVRSFYPISRGNNLFLINYEVDIDK